MTDIYYTKSYREIEKLFKDAIGKPSVIGISLKGINTRCKDVKDFIEAHKNNFKHISYNVEGDISSKQLYFV